MRQITMAPGGAEAGRWSGARELGGAPLGFTGPAPPEIPERFTHIEPGAFA